MAKINRNEICPCRSGKKYKKCCYLISVKEEKSKIPHADNSIQTRLETALTHQRAGQLPQAEALYQQILKIQPKNADALHLLGTLANQVGKNEIAINLINRAIEINPSKSIYHNNLGNALKFHGKLTEAIKSYQTAVKLDSKISDFFNNLGNAWQDLGEFEAAEINFRQAIALNPNYAGAYFNLANLLQMQKKYPAAIENYQKAIFFKPDYSAAYSNLGVAYKESGHLNEAIDCYQKALVLNPHYSEAYSNLGVALQESGKFNAAVENYQKSLAINPSVKTYNNLGVTFKNLGRLNEATQSFQAALSIQPYDASILNNFGTLLEKQNKLDEAIKIYEHALTLNSQCHLTHNNLGNALKSKHQLKAAIASYQSSLRIKPNYSTAHSNLLHTQLHCSDWTNYQHNVETAKQKIISGDTEYTPFAFLNICDSPALQQQCARHYATAKYPLAETLLWTGQRYQHTKIRVAYLSADLREHAVSYLMAGVFEKQDKNQFEIIAISLMPEEKSLMGQRIKAAFDQFIDVSQKSDFEVATLMRELEIDIAVDLMGFTKSSRTGILSYRPAPIQVNYLGYPGTMGADYMDYIIADRHLIPEEQQVYYSEKVIYLPDTYQPNDATRVISENVPTRAQVNLPKTGFVFCCFNDSYKISPEIFTIWMRLLAKVEGSVLWIAERNAFVSENLRQEASNRGINPQRLIFAPRVQNIDDYLARQKVADLFLDTLPYNAHTTASDALWAELPVLTCMGNSFVSRVAGSVLYALGMSELVTTHLADYEALAFKLATTPELLAEIRAKLAKNRDTYPLFNTELFCRNLENAYKSMWENYQRKDML
jgi:predicted O-linked N-acetylglucosamine transferase (SPINDLY family)